MVIYCMGDMGEDKSVKNSKRKLHFNIKTFKSFQTLLTLCNFEYFIRRKKERNVSSIISVYADILNLLIKDESDERAGREIMF